MPRPGELADEATQAARAAAEEAHRQAQQLAADAEQQAKDADQRVAAAEQAGKCAEATAKDTAQRLRSRQVNGDLDSHTKAELLDLAAAIDIEGRTTHDQGGARLRDQAGLAHRTLAAWTEADGQRGRTWDFCSAGRGSSKALKAVGDAQLPSAVGSALDDIRPPKAVKSGLAAAVAAHRGSAAVSAMRRRARGDRRAIGEADHPGDVRSRLCHGDQGGT